MLSKNFVLLIVLINIAFSQDTLFFVYNSTDDFYTIISDTIHKSVKPNTYSCQLCKLTYNTFSKKKRWKEFLSSLDIEHQFFYKNDSFIINNQITEFPVILIGSSKNYKTLLSKDDIGKNKNLEELINMIDVKLKQYHKLKN